MEKNGQIEGRRFDHLIHIEKPHYAKSIFPKNCRNKIFVILVMNQMTIFP
jgi:hypothetical protein